MNANRAMLAAASSTQLTNNFYARIFKQLFFYKTVYPAWALLPLEAWITLAACYVGFTHCICLLFDSDHAGLFRS